MFVHTMIDIGGGESHNVQRFGRGARICDILKSVLPRILRMIHSLRAYSSDREVKIKVVLEAEPLD
jgi:hypothetical protein